MVKLVAIGTGELSVRNCSALRPEGVRGHLELRSGRRLGSRRRRGIAQPSQSKKSGLPALCRRRSRQVPPRSFPGPRSTSIEYWTWTRSRAFRRERRRLRTRPRRILRQLPSEVFVQPRGQKTEERELPDLPRQKMPRRTELPNK